MPDWFMHNPIADLPPGPFLATFAIVIVAVIWACCTAIRGADPTSDYDLPEVPKKPDPYEIAYLRGGANEVMRTCIFNLVQKGCVEVSGKEVRRTEFALDRERADAMETRVYDALALRTSASALFQSAEVAKSLSLVCEPIRKRLENDDLLAKPEVKGAIGPVGAMGLLIVLAFGGYRLYLAYLKGRHNIGFLIMMTLVGSISLLIASAVAGSGHTSRRGRAYLERLRLAFSSLKTPAKAAKSSYVEPDLLLAVGLFGYMSLDGTNYAALNKAFRQSGDGGGCGGGCGGGGCGGGGCGGGGCGG